MAANTPENSGIVKCAQCGKAFRWKPDLAGRKVRCNACQQVFVMPASPPGAGTPPARADTSSTENDDSGYELNMDAAPLQSPAKQAGGKKCPSCGQSIRPEAVICINCGFHLKEGKKLSTDIGVTQQEGGDSGSSRKAE